MTHNQLRDPRNDALRPQRVVEVPLAVVPPPMPVVPPHPMVSPPAVPVFEDSVPIAVVGVRPPQQQSKTIPILVFSVIVGLGGFFYYGELQKKEATDFSYSQSVAATATDAIAASAAAAAATATAGTTEDAAVVDTPAAVDAVDGEVAAPQVQVGDTWHMKTTDLRAASGSYADVSFVVDQVDSDRVYITKTVTARPDSATPLIYNTQMNLEQGKTGSYSPAMQYYDFPLHVGKEWTSTSAITGNAQKDSQKVEAKVVGWETIQTPMGEFNALQIDANYTSYLNGSVVSQGADRSWYVPELKRAVRTEEYSWNEENQEWIKSRVHELTSYKAAE